MMTRLVLAISLALTVSAGAPTAAQGVPLAGGPQPSATLPDLIPSQLRIEAGDDGDECSASFRLTVKNKGGSDAGPYSVSVAVIRNGVELFSFPIKVDGTAAHDKTTLTGSFGAEGGTYRLDFGVNQFNPVVESDFSNNTLLSRPFACPADKG